MQLTRNKKIIASHTYEVSDHEVVMQPGNDGDAPMVLRYVEVAVMHLITLHNTAYKRFTCSYHTLYCIDYIL